MHSPRVPAAAALAMLALAWLVVACGDKSQSAATGDAASSPELFKRGQLLHKTRGCAACHSLDGTSLAGPTYAGLYNSRVELRDGTTITADAAYLRAGILEPAKHLRRGFEEPMPSQAGLLSEKDIDALIAFIRQTPKPTTTP